MGGYPESWAASKYLSLQGKSSKSSRESSGTPGAAFTTVCNTRQRLHWESVREIANVEGLF